MRSRMALTLLADSRPSGRRLATDLACEKQRLRCVGGVLFPFAFEVVGQSVPCVG